MYEAPKVQKIEKEADYVFEKFKAFKAIDFNIKEFPELHERLVELANMPDSHFEDAVKMAEVVELLWSDINKEPDIESKQEELLLACLFHDIGKSGPLNANREQRLMIEQIFNPVYFDINNKNFKNNPKFFGKSVKEQKMMMKDLSINEILDIEDFSNKDAIKEYLQTLELHIYDEETNQITVEPLDLNNHSMIQLWREHDYWTYELLDHFKKGKITRELIIIASSHHTLEGHDPALVDGNVPNEAIALETIDKYLIITLVDKYQAFIDREKVDHSKAIEILRGMAKDSKDKKIINHQDRVYNLFIKYIGILEKHPEIAEIIGK